MKMIETSHTGVARIGGPLSVRDLYYFHTFWFSGEVTKPRFTKSRATKLPNTPNVRGAWPAWHFKPVPNGSLNRQVRGIRKNDCLANYALLMVIMYFRGALRLVSWFGWHGLVSRHHQLLKAMPSRCSHNCLSSAALFSWRTWRQERSAAHWMISRRMDDWT
jgi:hypothetical protein